MFLILEKETTYMQNLSTHSPLQFPLSFSRSGAYFMSDTFKRATYYGYNFALDRILLVSNHWWHLTTKCFHVSSRTTLMGFNFVQHGYGSVQHCKQITRKSCVDRIWQNFSHNKIIYIFILTLHYMRCHEKKWKKKTWLASFWSWDFPQIKTSLFPIRSSSGL